MDTDFINDVMGKLGLARASKHMLIGMAVVLVLAAAVVAHVLSSAAAASDFEIQSSVDDSSSEQMQFEQTHIFVHVSGEVVNPGLYEIDNGSRVADAVNAAGGFTELADEGSCNLARLIDDGEHVVIACKPEVVTGADGERENDAHEPSASSSVVNINTATAEQLETLPGIGSSTAQKIVLDRQANGSYRTVDDLMRVPGIGQKKLDALESLICV